MTGWPRCERLRALLAGAELVVVPDPGLERLLEETVDAARAAWPAVAVDDDAFLDHLAGALRRGGASAVEAWLARGTASELYLACACAAGHPGALAAFDAHYLAGLDATLARLDLPRWAVDDVKQDVRQRLLVGEGARSPRIAEFTGAGNLRGWLRVVAINAARQLLRQAGRAPAGAELVDVVPPVADDAELEILKTHYRAVSRRVRGGAGRARAARSHAAPPALWQT